MAASDYVSPAPQNPLALKGASTDGKRTLGGADILGWVCARTGHGDRAGKRTLTWPANGALSGVHSDHAGHADKEQRMIVGIAQHEACVIVLTARLPEEFEAGSPHVVGQLQYIALPED